MSVKSPIVPESGALIYKFGIGLGLPYKAKLSGKLSDMTLQAKAYAMVWTEQYYEAHTVGTSLECNGGCTCDHRFTATSHAAFCPLGEKGEPSDCPNNLTKP
jgi:hypothetical protein